MATGMWTPWCSHMIMNNWAQFLVILLKVPSTDPRLESVSIPRRVRVVKSRTLHDSPLDTSSSNVWSKLGDGLDGRRGSGSYIGIWGNVNFIQGVSKKIVILEMRPQIKKWLEQKFLKIVQIRRKYFQKYFLRNIFNILKIFFWKYLKKIFLKYIFWLFGQF